MTTLHRMPGPHPSARRPSRRDFLRWSGLGGLACLLPHRGAFAAPPRAAAEGRVLVHLELAGGNDGLNTLVPFADDAYHRARPRLALAPDAVLRLDGAVGLHPALGPFAELLQRGRLAVVEGVGYPEPTRSHFLATDIWHAAHAAGRRHGSGWLGRLAESLEPDPTAATLIAVGEKMPFACAGAEQRAIAVASPVSFRLLGAEQEVAAIDEAVAAGAVMADAPAERAGRLAFLRDAYQGARRASERVREAAARYTPDAAYPESALARDLGLVAALLAGGLETRVFTLKMKGFDTHSAQAARQQRLLEELGQALAAFDLDLAAKRLDERVLVVVQSEFGRRVAENDSGGTDHGTAGPMFLVGRALAGGLYGARPDPARLDPNGDLIHTTDFRSVYATVVERWLGVAPGVAVEAPPPRFDFLA